MISEKRSLHPLTSLRFFAAAAIVVLHAQHVFGNSWIRPGFPLWQGVSFFFVLSGFILAYNYPVLASRREVLLFYAARFARVWPGHIAAILLFVGLVCLKGGWANFHLGWYAVANALLLQAWIPYSSFYFSLNSVSWTLSVELLFYLLFPLIIWNWAKRWHICLVIGAILIGCLVCISNYYKVPAASDNPGQIILPALVSINPLARIFEFMLGVAACSFYRQVSLACQAWTVKQATVLEFVTMLSVIFFMGLSVTIHETDHVYTWVGAAGRYYWAGSGTAVIFGVAIFVFAVGRGWISRLLSSRFAVTFGEISFALYLIHNVVLPCFGYFSKFIADYPALSYAAYWIVCLALSYAIFIFIEQPARSVFMSQTRKFLNRTKVAESSEFSLRHTIKPIAIAGIFVLGALGVSYWLRPNAGELAVITERDITDALAANPPSLENIHFADRIELRALSVSRKASDATVRIWWRPLAALQEADWALFVHSIDDEGKIVVANHMPLNLHAVQPGDKTMRFDAITFKAPPLHESRRLAIGFVRPNQSLLIADKGTRDWGNRRVILPIPMQ